MKKSDSKQYECVMKPKKPIILHAETYEVTSRPVVVENFSIDKRGRKRRGKIRCVIPIDVRIRKVQ